MSFALGLIGLLLLFYLCEFTGYDEVGDVDGPVNGVIKIEGSVEAVGGNDNVTYITVSRKELLKVVVFGEVDVDEGSGVEIIGKMSEDGEEMIASRIRSY